MPHSKKIGAALSWGYFGYMDDNYCMSKINSETGDNDKVYAVCDMPLGHFNRIAFERLTNKPKCFDFYIGNHKSKPRSADGKAFYQDYMGFTSGSEIWFVSEDTEEIFIFQSHMSILYMVGRLHDDSDLAGLCRWRYKRIRL